LRYKFFHKFFLREWLSRFKLAVEKKHVLYFMTGRRLSATVNIKFTHKILAQRKHELLGIIDVIQYQLFHFTNKCLRRLRLLMFPIWEHKGQKMQKIFQPWSRRKAVLNKKGAVLFAVSRQHAIRSRNSWWRSSDC